MPQAGTPDNLFVTSDELNGAAPTEPSIWPEFPSTAPTVTGDGGCSLTAATVRAQWRELHVWSVPDRAKVFAVAPSFVTRWNRLTAEQQAEIRTGYSHTFSSFPDCPLSTADPKADYSFYLAHPTVWEWAQALPSAKTGVGWFASPAALPKGPRLRAALFTRYATPGDSTTLSASHWTGPRLLSTGHDVWGDRPGDRAPAPKDSDPRPANVTGNRSTRIPLQTNPYARRKGLLQPVTPSPEP